MKVKRGIIVLGLLSAANMPMWAQQIKGVFIDQKSKETLIGAVVTVDGTNVKAITNIDGNFQIDGLDKEKTYTLYINWLFANFGAHSAQLQNSLRKFYIKC